MNKKPWSYKRYDRWAVKPFIAGAGVVLIQPGSSDPHVEDERFSTYAVQPHNVVFYSIQDKDGGWFAFFSNVAGPHGRFGPRFNTWQESDALAFVSAKALASGKSGIFGKKALQKITS